MEETIQIPLEKATRNHFIYAGAVQFGSLFYVRSQQSGVFNGPYLLKDDPDRLANFKQWLNADMVWIQKRRI